MRYSNQQSLFVDSNVFIFANIKDYLEDRIAKERLMNLIETESRILIRESLISITSQQGIPMDLMWVRRWISMTEPRQRRR